MDWWRLFGKQEARAQLLTQKDVQLVELLGGEEHFGQRVEAAPGRANFQQT